MTQYFHSLFFIFVLTLYILIKKINVPKGLLLNTTGLMPRLARPKLPSLNELDCSYVLIAVDIVIL